MTTKIEVLRRQIVEAQTKGKDTSVLEKQLKEARLDEQAKAEVAELQKVADQRLKWQKEADKVKARAEAQGSAIDHLLELRDNIAGPLKELIDRARAYDLVKAQNDCYTEFHDTFMFGAVVGHIPVGYLPKGFACPQLEMIGGQTSADDKAAEALWYMQAAYGCLAGIVKGSMAAFQREVDDGVGHDTKSEEDEGQSQSCIVCQHSEREKIDQAIKNNRSLRDIETEFGTSRSSLSRHKNTCLNLGAIRVVEVSEG